MKKSGLLFLSSVLLCSTDVWAVGNGCGGVGSVVYDDLNCYASQSEGRKPIGIMAGGGYVMTFYSADDRMHWSKFEGNVAGLADCTDEEAVMECSTDGSSNTEAIYGQGEHYTSSEYAPGYCYNLTDGGVKAGTWFLPSMQQLKMIFENRGTLNAVFTGMGVHGLNEGYHWSSTEYDDKFAWLLGLTNGYADYNRKNESYYAYVRCLMRLNDVRK